MKTGLLLGLLLIGGLSYYLSGELFFLLMIVLVIVFCYNDKAIIYNSSYSVILPFLLLISLGIIRGIGNLNKDFYRDFYIFSKNIVYFFCGIAISKYLKDINTFFRYFLVLAFISALIHIGLFIVNIQSAASLESIRQTAGYGNVLEGIVMSMIAARIFSGDFKKLIKDLPKNSIIMILVVGLSFLLYFSRTLIVLFVILSFFLCDIIYIRKIFSPKNAKVLRASFVVFILCYSIGLIASLGSSNSPLQRLVDKFEQIPTEVSWSAKKNSEATLDDINDNWRGYEAYQGLLKFYKGDNLQKSFGYGFSTRIDLGLTMKLAGDDYDDVPIMHNEFMTLLIKSGIVGTLLYLSFLYKIGASSIKYSKEDHPEIYYSYQMLSALSVVCLITTYIGFGLIDIGTTALPMALGFFWGNIQRQKYSSETIPAPEANLALTN